MIIRNESNVVGLYESYGYRFVGCVADYESEYINIGVARKAITKIAIIDQKTGKTIYKEILGNRVIFFDTFEKHCDDILYHLSKNTFDRIDLENLVNKLVKNGLTLFSHNIEIQKRKEAEERALSERIEKAKEQENRLLSLAHDKKYEIYFGKRLYILKFESDKDKQFWNQLEDTKKDMAIERIHTESMTGINIVFESDYNYFGNTSNMVKSGLESAIEFLESYEEETDSIDQELMNTIAIYMNDEIRERVHFELAPCSPKEFLKRYLELDPDFSELLYNEFDIELDNETLTLEYYFSEDVREFHPKLLNRTFTRSQMTEVYQDIVNKDEYHDFQEWFMDMLKSGLVMEA